MKKGRRLAAMLLCLSLTVSGFGFGFGTAQADTDAAYMQQTVEKLGKRIEGQSMFDYLSYVYMGWRTTGGSWQNQVIDTFIVDELKEAGYSHSGEATTSVGHRSINDKSNATDDDYSWVTYFDVSDLTWNPEYAKLEISSEEEFQGKDKLIDKINVEAYGFNPTTDTYLEHYEVASIDKMWSWLAEKTRRETE